MQLMPKTAKWLGITKPKSVKGSVRGGTKYLRMMIEKYDGNIALALAAYNAGPGNVAKYGRTIPPFRETRQFVRKVILRERALVGKFPVEI